MANFKNITDLPIIESADGVNLIVNDNGRAKQIAASAVGGGGVKSWNDLEDKPFGVKTEMVEIVPEQSVTIDDEGDFSITGDFTLTADKEYTVLFNGETYVEKAKTASEPAEIAGSVWLGFNPFFGTDMDKPYTIMKHPQMGLMTNSSLNGETITLAICEEKEVVIQLDPKFVGASGGGVVFYVSKGTGNGYIYKDADCTEKVTAEEIKALIGQSIVLSAFGESFMYVCSMMLWDNTWFELHCFNYDMTNKISYYTAEKTNNTLV